MEDHHRQLFTPPPEEQPIATKIKYTKKARHGHGKDVTDIHNVRQVAGCLPIDPVSKRFLLISSSKNPSAWVIPKGGWETDETQEHAALRETWEEAGIKGKITRHLGVFVERANKRIKAHHWIFEMEIEEIKKKYPERKKRDRRWFTYQEALLATENNEYIQEAIRLSSISPCRLQSHSPPNISATHSSAESPDTNDAKTSNAFNTLTQLMENRTPSS